MMKHPLKFIFATMLFSLTLSATALEIKGIKVDETAQVGGSALVLNGAGVRTKLMFKVYTATTFLNLTPAKSACSRAYCPCR